MGQNIAFMPNYHGSQIQMHFIIMAKRITPKRGLL